MDHWQERLSEDLKREPLDKMGVTDRVKTGLKLRLSYEIPYIKTWPEAMALGILPQNIWTTTQKVLKIADEIWYYAGDTAVDYNWYTKRILLTTVFTSTELFMLTDRSHNNFATWEFLDRRISDILNIGGNLRNFRNFAGAFGIGLSSIASILKPIPESGQDILNRKQAESDKENTFR